MNTERAGLTHSSGRTVPILATAPVRPAGSSLRRRALDAHVEDVVLTILPALERFFGVEHAAAEVVVPRGCRTFTRQQLWNDAERAEQRKDARTAREWELGLPCELSKEQRIELVHRFAEELAKRYGTAVDYALHAPSSRGDQRNYHAHVMQTTRQVRDGVLQEKALLEWNDKKLQAEGYAVGRKQVEEIRALWAELSNQALERSGSEERVDHRSLKTQHAEALKEAVQLRSDGKEMEAQFAELKALELERTTQMHVGWRVGVMWDLGFFAVR